MGSIHASARPRSRAMRRQSVQGRWRLEDKEMVNTFFGSVRADRSPLASADLYPLQRAEQADCLNPEAQDIESTLAKASAMAKAEAEQRLRQEFAAALLEQRQEIARCEIEKLDTSFGLRLHVAAGDGQKW